MSPFAISKVVDKTASVYRVGSPLWGLRPRGGAESLDGDDNILVTKLTGSQLCSIDTIQLHDRSSHMYAGFVSLGEFVPYRKVDTAAKFNIGIASCRERVCQYV